MSSSTSPYVRTKNGGQKFVGGAAMQRINAKKRIKKQGARILKPDEIVKSKEAISVKLSPFERFFAGLLRSEAREYISGRGDKELWATICRRLSLPVLRDPLPPSFDSQRAHFSSRASLVMEESRQALADAIRLFDQRCKQSRQSNHHTRPKNAHGNRRGQEMETMKVFLKSVDYQEKTGHSILVFEKENLSKADIYMLRYGSIFACIQSKFASTVENVVLGAVMPQSRDEMEKSNSFAVMVFKSITAKTAREQWHLTALTSLLSEQRKFDACMELTKKNLPILFPVLGKRKAQHTRFHEDDNGNTVSTLAEDSEPDSDCEMLEVIDVEATFQLPRLNHSQEAAAKAFLSSKSNEITLIQGPPGTGKTTLLTSVIGRYVVESQKMEHTKRQLLVCAPTNKAITVLCTRFLNSIIDNEAHPCNAVLVGDDEKLIDDDFHHEKRSGKPPSRLRSIFLYTFIDAIRDDYLYIQRTLARSGAKNNAMLGKLRSIARRLNNRLVANVTDKNALASSDRIVELMCEISSKQTHHAELRDELNLILKLMSEWNRESIWREILQRADVIFCTLASSGASFLKKTISQVEDLIVDEAAASTEPELYIPFSYMPLRLLCVGDPKQLPATVSSVTAEKLGLSMSLHERLMYHCDFKHVMLDRQYRMHPEISQWPCCQFYAGKLTDGANVRRPGYLSGINAMSKFPYTLFQVYGEERQGRSGSYENMAEAQSVVELVQLFRTCASKKFGKDWCSNDRLRIITFYQAQVALISRLLRQKGMADVLVATVDSSQGCEADHVIVSFVRSEGGRNRNSVGFLADERRLNVALTRSKHQLICVGNIERMYALSDSKAATVRCLAKDAKERNCIIPFDGDRCEVERNTTRKRAHDNLAASSPSKRRGVLLPANEAIDSEVATASTAPHGPAPSFPRTEGSASDSDSSSVSSSSSSSSESASTGDSSDSDSRADKFDASSTTSSLRVVDSENAFQAESDVQVSDTVAAQNSRPVEAVEAAEVTSDASMLESATNESSVERSSGNDLNQADSQPAHQPLATKTCDGSTQYESSPNVSETIDLTSTTCNESTQYEPSPDVPESMRDNAPSVPPGPVVENPFKKMQDASTQYDLLFPASAPKPDPPTQQQVDTDRSAVLIDKAPVASSVEESVEEVVIPEQSEDQTVVPKPDPPPAKADGKCSTLYEDFWC